MIAVYVLYCFLASLLLGVVGYLFEHVARLLALPARLAWAGGLVLVLFLAASAPFRAPAETPALVEEAGQVAPTPASAVGEGAGGLTLTAGIRLGKVFDGVLRWAAPLARGRWGIVLALAWAALSALVLGVGLGVLHHEWRRRRRWPRAVLLGETVRIAPRDGPAVVGFIRPEILVPRWLVEAGEERQHMAIQHEREHLRAGDQYLLALAGLATMLLPWNPVIWWMCGRLRAAIELDCDHRVLGRGVHPREYGSFLIETAALGPSRLRGAVTLAPSTSTLSRRLRAMTDSQPRHRLTRAILVAALGGVALTAACESRLPTQAEIDGMDVAVAEAKFQELISAREVANVAYFVDGVEVTPTAAKAIAAEGIARIEVTRGAEGDRLAILTKAAGGKSDLAVPAPADVAEPRDTLRTVAEGRYVLQKVQAFQGLVVIDGEVVSADHLRTLQPSAIASVEVIKGKAAEAIYSQPEAAQGVIRITTKRLP